MNSIKLVYPIAAKKLEDCGFTKPEYFDENIQQLYEHINSHNDRVSDQDEARDEYLRIKKLMAENKPYSPPTEAKNNFTFL